MPVLKSPKRELFAQQLAKGRTIAEAKDYAGYSPGGRHDGRIVDATRERVKEIQQKGAESVLVTVSGLVRELDDVLAMAQRIDAPGAAVQAVMAKAKLCGLITDKQAVTVESASNDSDLARWLTAKMAKDDGDVEPARAVATH